MNCRTFVIVLALLLALDAESANPLDTWTVIHSEKSARRLFRIGFGEGRFVAVGEMVLSSSDGRIWTEGKTPIEYPRLALVSVAYGAGLFVIVSGEGPILSSHDGIDWTGHTPASGVWLIDITYGDGRFVAVGDNRKILESGSLVELAINRNGPADGLTLTLAGRRGETYAVQSSADLMTWTDAANATLGSAGSVEVNLPVPARDRVFYRALQPESARPAE